jgi:hypothetical protein
MKQSRHSCQHTNKHMAAENLRNNKADGSGRHTRGRTSSSNITHHSGHIFTHHFVVILLTWGWERTRQIHLRVSAHPPPQLPYVCTEDHWMLASQCCLKPNISVLLQRQPIKHKMKGSSKTGRAQAQQLVADTAPSKQVLRTHSDCPDLDYPRACRKPVIIFNS